MVRPELDAVLHFAAFIAAGESVAAPEKYWENNVLGSLRLLDAVRTAGVPRLVFSSTANIYGNPTELPITETAVAAPPNPYATSKLAVEYALTGDATAHGLAAVSLRYFNAAGALIRSDGSRGERHEPETHLIPNALLVAAGLKEKLPLYGDDYPTPDGTCVRDYIHVTDLATAHLAALGAVRPGEHRVYNLGNGTGFSNHEVVQAVREVTGHPIPVEMAPRRPATQQSWSPHRARPVPSSAGRLASPVCTRSSPTPGRSPSPALCDRPPRPSSKMIISSA